MKIIVNNKEIEAAENISIAELLKAQEVKMPEMVSVELNGSILSRKTFEETLLKAGDTVEFLYYMGGG